MFFLLLLIMVLLATTELGTDSWISDIMHTVLQSPTLGTLFLVWTSLIMFVLRFFAGPIVHRIGPLGLLAASAAVAAMGLLWLSKAGTSPVMLFAAATFYGFGKTFFWPTTLGVVSEQYPRGGALMLNAIAGVGMISVGTIGNPAIGAVQDIALTAEIRAADPALAERLIVARPGLFGESSRASIPRSVPCWLKSWQRRPRGSRKACHRRSLANRWRACRGRRSRPIRTTRSCRDKARCWQRSTAARSRRRWAGLRCCRSSCSSAIWGSSRISGQPADTSQSVSCPKLAESLVHKGRCNGAAVRP